MVHRCISLVFQHIYRFIQLLSFLLTEPRSLRKEIALQESQAQSNFLDAVLQVARERSPYDIRTASRMIENRDQESDAWKKEAKTRLTARPTQMIKQPIPSHWKQAETQMQNSFNKSEQKMRSEMKADSAEIDEQKASLQAQNKASEEA